MSSMISVLFTELVATVNPVTNKSFHKSMENISIDEGIRLARDRKVHDVNVFRPADMSDKDWKAITSDLVKDLNASSIVYQRKRDGRITQASPDESTRGWIPIVSSFVGYSGHSTK